MKRWWPLLVGLGVSLVMLLIGAGPYLFLSRDCSDEQRRELPVSECETYN